MVAGPGSTSFYINTDEKRHLTKMNLFNPIVMLLKNRMRLSLILITHDPADHDYCRL